MNRKTLRVIVISGAACAAVICGYLAKRPSTEGDSTIAPIRQTKSLQQAADRPAEPGVKAEPTIAARDWSIAYEPLNEKEQEEVALVYEQIKLLNTIGRIEADRMDELRGTVFKFKERIIADAGRRVLLEGSELARTKEGAETVVTLIDTLAYFGRNGADWPLSIEILRDIGTRSIKFNSTLTPEEKSTANITIQAFEQYARYRPDEAVSFVAANVEKAKRFPYIAYLKTGLALAGFSKDEIQRKTAGLI